MPKIEYGVTKKAVTSRQILNNGFVRALHEAKWGDPAAPIETSVSVAYAAGGPDANDKFDTGQPTQFFLRQYGYESFDLASSVGHKFGELLHVTQVLSEMAGAGLEMVDTENLRPHYARTLWAWSDALEAQLSEALAVLQRNAGQEGGRAERILRAYRLYLAGSAMSFEQGWISLHQMLAIRPDGELASGALRGAQSVYPFTRDYIYE